MKVKSLSIMNNWYLRGVIKKFEDCLYKIKTPYINEILNISLTSYF